MELSVTTPDGDELQVETLYQACSVGGYAILQSSPWIYTAKAKTPLTLQVLTKEKLDAKREQYPELDK